MSDDRFDAAEWAVSYWTEQLGFAQARLDEVELRLADAQIKLAERDTENER